MLPKSSVNLNDILIISFTKFLHGLTCRFLIVTAFTLE